MRNHERYNYKLSLLVYSCVSQLCINCYLCKEVTENPRSFPHKRATTEQQLHEQRETVLSLHSHGTSIELPLLSIVERSVPLQ